jgi:hypothetical protein
VARVYITHKGEDRPLAIQLGDVLKKLGDSVSIDNQFLVPGQEWKLEIRQAINAADGIVALISEHTMVQGTQNILHQWIASEIGAARGSGKFVIPVMMDEIWPVPPLIDDLFVLYPRSREIEAIGRDVHEAIQKHMSNRARDQGLFLPAGYEHLASAVRMFREDFSYEQWVFVMMKFPDPNSMDASHCKMLEDIWNVLRGVLSTYGLQARRADKKDYLDNIWDNLCVYMLGSKYGIAILEDRVAAETNPNVTLEYGFMRALNRKVALFREASFRHDRADLTGKLSKSFEISESLVLNEDKLKVALQGWLIDLGIPPKVRE